MTTMRAIQPIYYSTRNHFHLQRLIEYKFRHKNGNGRTARLLLNLELMKDGFPPVIIKVANRLEYYESLDKAHTSKKYSDFIQLVATELEDSLNLYLSVT